MESTSRQVDESRNDDVNAGKRKTPRKSRSRGLRTKTGW
jgi:hypothetical protein